MGTANEARVPVVEIVPGMRGTALAALVPFAVPKLGLMAATSDEDLYKVEKGQLLVRLIECLKLNFTSCLVHQPRLVEVIILYFIYYMVIVN